ncbi:hypothetical protein HA150_08140 [Prochlorococcus marinus XMU1414]|uniref:Uncharacterized protein n=1 Tax=Prochlorococcus marinus XMU1424 TaxID=2774497 RepID=A0A9D9BX87_PROMR|nr:hypothetical protein [Prochlorococcus marinus]MBO8228868.1 hypothetical protein [Prochlorococcus marinus XMU1414]MBW3046327.1 hypothetical protein [Prochlorococcus marinus str. MU1414]MCR8531363.1 hypothetical protein [Prochlorococcus marinus XMU1420]MCR8535091.1 hypothetical protein [Prochlorococcus marinus XMU1424]
MSKLNEDQKNELIKLYFVEKFSSSQLAKKYGVSGSSILKVIREKGFKPRSFSEALFVKKNPFSEDQIKEIIKRYETDGETQIEIAKKLNTGQSQIGKILKRYGIKMRTREEVDEKRSLVKNDQLQTLYKRYINDKNLTTKQLAAEIGIKRQTLEAAFNRKGFKLRDSHEAAAYKNTIFKEDQSKEIVRQHFEENKSVKELVDIFNASYSTICNVIDKYSKKQRRLEQVFWDKEKIISYARDVFLNEYEGIPKDEEIRTNHRGWSAAVPRHLKNGIFEVYQELGLKPKQRSSNDLTDKDKEKIIELYKFGFSLSDLEYKFNVPLAPIRQIIINAGIEIRPATGGFDSMDIVLNRTGFHKITRETFYYIVGINGYPGYIKPGISFDLDHRATQSYGFYGEEFLNKIFPSRDEAYFMEEAILRETIFRHQIPEELAEWDGRTEIRKMDPNELINIFDYYLDQLEELGKWEFACLYVPMTEKQRKQCKKNI